MTHTPVKSEPEAKQEFDFDSWQANIDADLQTFKEMEKALKQEEQVNAEARIKEATEALDRLSQPEPPLVDRRQNRALREAVDKRLVQAEHARDPNLQAQAEGKENEPAGTNVSPDATAHKQLVKDTGIEL